MNVNEQFKKYKTEYVNELSRWLDSREDWILLAITVTFKPIDANNTEDRWIQEYKTRVLYRIARRLEHNKRLRDKAIPYPEIVYFDQNYHSMFKGLKSSNPPHVHGVVPIPKKVAYRVWNQEKVCLNKKLENDIYSMRTVGSLHVDLINRGVTKQWINYILKGDKEL